MLTKIDKALIAGAVSFGALVLLKFFGVDINATMQGSIVGLLTMAMTYIVPNKA